MSKKFNTYQSQISTRNLSYSAGYAKGMSERGRNIRCLSHWSTSDIFGRGYRAGWTAAHQAA